MVSLYDEVCLKSFPDDAVVDAAMAAKGATPLTRKQVEIYLHDDPGRGWWLADGDEKLTITVEAHPCHACSVRRQTPAGFADLAPYQTLADVFEAPTGGFVKMKPTNINVGDITSHVIGEQRIAGDGSAEALYVFSNTPAKPQDGTGAGAEVRFVHQLVSPRAR
jgi:hypothetical protein